MVFVFFIVNFCLLEENFDFISLDYELEGDIFEDDEDYLVDEFSQFGVLDSEFGGDDFFDVFGFIVLVFFSKLFVFVKKKQYLMYKDDVDLVKFKQELEVVGEFCYCFLSRFLLVFNWFWLFYFLQRFFFLIGLMVKKLVLDVFIFFGICGQYLILQIVRFLLGVFQ